MFRNIILPIIAATGVAASALPATASAQSVRVQYYGDYNTGYNRHYYDQRGYYDQRYHGYGYDRWQAERARRYWARIRYERELERRRHRHDDRWDHHGGRDYDDY